MVERVADAERARGTDLGRRLSVFWGTQATLSGETAGGRFPPLDRLDLIENGRLLLGIDSRDGLARPTAGELVVTGAEFALEFLAGIGGHTPGAAACLGSMQPAGSGAIEEIRDAEVLLARGVRRVTKLVLFPVRFMFTAATGPGRDQRARGRVVPRPG